MLTLNIFNHKDIMTIVSKYLEYPNYWPNFALINKTCYQVYQEYYQKLQNIKLPFEFLFKLHQSNISYKIMIKCHECHLVFARYKNSAYKFDCFDCRKMYCKKHMAGYCDQCSENQCLSCNEKKRKVFKKCDVNDYKINGWGK